MFPVCQTAMVELIRAHSKAVVCVCSEEDIVNAIITSHHICFTGLNSLPGFVSDREAEMIS